MSSGWVKRSSLPLGSTPSERGRSPNSMKPVGQLVRPSGKTQYENATSKGPASRSPVLRTVVATSTTSWTVTGEGGSNVSATGLRSGFPSREGTTLSETISSLFVSSSSGIWSLESTTTRISYTPGAGMSAGSAVSRTPLTSISCSSGASPRSSTTAKLVQLGAPSPGSGRARTKNSTLNAEAAFEPVFSSLAIALTKRPRSTGDAGSKISAVGWSSGWPPDDACSSPNATAPPIPTPKAKIHTPMRSARRLLLAILTLLGLRPASRPLQR